MINKDLILQCPYYWVILAIIIAFLLGRIWDGYYKSTYMYYKCEYEKWRDKAILHEKNEKVLKEAFKTAQRKLNERGTK